VKRTPIIIPGQVYLHKQLNEYLVVTKATRGDIQFKGPGFGGMNEVELFLERFEPVDPADLEPAEALQLRDLVSSNVVLTVGWVQPDEDGEFDEDDE
jgi:hypothetical protein